MKTAIYYFVSCFLLSSLFFTSFSQSILYEENFGAPSTSATIQSYTGWQNQQVVYAGDGTCDIRTSNASTGYTSASGGGNVMLNNSTKWFSISGINTTGQDSLKLHLGIRKGNTGEDGSNLSIQYSTNGENWERIPEMQPLPTGSGTTGWYYITITGLPATSNLRLLFSNLANNDIRIDDLSITAHSDNPLPSLRVNSPVHGSSHSQAVSFNFTLTNFTLGTDGLLSLNLSGTGFDTTLNIFTTSELTILATSPLYVPVGSYTLISKLLDITGNPLHPEVTVSTQFTVVMPTVATPEISPIGGVYTEAQTVQITCETENAHIYYTIDGSIPDDNGLLYTTPIIIAENHTLKAIAVKAGMTTSAVASAQFVIQDNTAWVTLPFDISDNSEVDQEDITLMRGFYTESMGSSYADGSAKFEQGKAGSAQLYISLDSSPDTLWFDLRGRNGGTSPQSYEGIVMEVLESPDNENWYSLLSLTESEISTSQYNNFCTTLSPETKYVKWFLSQASKGNTQLNNIKISKHDGSIVDTTEVTDTTFIVNFKIQDFKIHPNPACNYLYVQAKDIIIKDIRIINMTGNVSRQFVIGVTSCRLSLDGLPSGIYAVKITTEQGVFTRKIIKME
ncbi:MAG: chitobiase/beta-hexosaminidase C-terminal domain-containing protein [Bacteroidales bacterium]|jgi:hypothetical protein|nr:chitobiase/beta-hexosaminidase C-terminal domain-containing protein [Bacteroidales bacterium]